MVICMPVAKNPRGEEIAGERLGMSKGDTARQNAEKGCSGAKRVKLHNSVLKPHLAIMDDGKKRSAPW